MRTFLVPGLLWFSAIGCGLMAGLYYAFSTFIMTALGRIAPASGMAAMNAINVDILRSSFLPLFLATTVAAGLLAAAGALRWGEPGSLAMLAGGTLYLLGMFGVTMLFNVPLNDALTAAGDGGGSAEIWARYVREWTMWNHVRTLSSTAALALFVVALVQR
ncbi:MULTISPECIES: anthrone oxygenase family protein [unclassified Sphingomonas]|jgi:uncharacterized membrane protein|nr:MULTISPECIES: anthrone oxygenase family protein [unclassified Sphingomonas]